MPGTPAMVTPDRLASGRTDLVGLVVDADVQLPVGQRLAVGGDVPGLGQRVADEAAQQQQAGGVLGDIDAQAAPGVGQMAGHLGDLIQADAGQGAHPGPQPVGGGLEADVGDTDHGRQGAAGPPLPAMPGGVIDQDQAQVAGVPQPPGRHPGHPAAPGRLACR